MATATFTAVVGNAIYQAEHTNNPRESTEQKHQKGQSRNKRDKPGGEKGDKRRPYRNRILQEIEY